VFDGALFLLGFEAAGFAAAVLALLGAAGAFALSADGFDSWGGASFDDGSPGDCLSTLAGGGVAGLGTGGDRFGLTCAHPASRLISASKTEAIPRMRLVYPY
jgi:hypothetical protein